MQSPIDLDQPPPPSDLPADSDALSADIEGFLQSVIADRLPPDHRTGPGHPLVLPSSLLWSALLVCVLRGATSRLAIWRTLAVKGLWHYPRVLVTNQAVYKRLDQAGSQPFHDLFVHVSALLRQRLAAAPGEKPTLAPFASAVVAIDETTLDPVARILPALRSVPRGDALLLPGKLSSIFDIRLQQWLHIEHQPNPQQNEKVAARSLLAHIPKGSLILADMGYFGFEWFDDLTKATYWWVSRLRKKTTYTVMHRFYEDATTFDGLVWLGAYRADRAARAVRLVRFQVGTRTYEYLTNVLDPQSLSLREIAALYVRRWDIEIAFRLLKQHLKLHVLWTGKEGVVMQQVWAVLLIAQIVQGLRMEIAKRAEVDVYDVSMKLLIEELPQFVALGRDALAEFVEHGRRAGYIRPSRRVVVEAPEIDPALYVPVPEGLVLERKPRYAKRKCGSRKKPPG